MCRIAFAIVLLWFSTAASAVVAQEIRVALVIGNDNYETVGHLDNPTRDAASIARALREIGFQTVQVESNLSHGAMIKALRRFEEASDKADWALVYYAGHGLEVGGINYLIPVDARLKSDRDVDEEAVSLPQVQKRLEGARKLRLVILDACRDNPFLTKMRRTQIASRSVGRGLAAPDLPQTGSLVAYAAAAGQTALDANASTENSPYAAALVKYLTVPDLEINLFFRRVRVDVLRTTANKQEPATYESLPDERFILRPGLNFSRRLIEECDRAAASIVDVDHLPGIAPVGPNDIKSDVAIPACRAAVASWGLSDESSIARLIELGDGPYGLELRRTLYQLGRALEAGKMKEEAKKRFQQAAKLYERAASFGNIDAMVHLGFQYSAAEGVSEKNDFVTAKRWFDKALAAGDVNAMVWLGVLYWDGDGVERDYQAAKALFEKAASKGNVNAMVSLGEMYEQQNSGMQDYEKSKYWFEKAAAAGHSYAKEKLSGLNK